MSYEPPIPASEGQSVAFPSRPAAQESHAVTFAGLPELLERLMVSSGLPQKQFAALFRVSPKTMGRWRRGESRPPERKRPNLLARAVRQGGDARLFSLALGLPPPPLPEPTSVPAPPPPEPPVVPAPEPVKPVEIAAPPAPPPPDLGELAITPLEAAIYLAAEALELPAGRVRPVLARFVSHLAGAGIDPAAARAALAKSD